MARSKDDGLTYDIDSPFCNVSTHNTVGQSKSVEDREIGRRFVLVWKVLSTKLQEIFQNVMLKLFSLSPHLTYVHKSSAFRIAGPCGKTQFSNLLRLETNRCLISVLLIYVLGIRNVLQRVILQASQQARNQHGHCVMAAPFASSPFRPPGESRLLFSRFLSVVAFFNFAICLALTPTRPGALR